METFGIILRIIGALMLLFWFIPALSMGNTKGIELLLIGLSALILILGGSRFTGAIAKFILNKKALPQKKRNNYLKQHGRMFLIPSEKIEIEGYNGERIIEAESSYTKHGAMSILFDPSKAHDRIEYFGTSCLKFCKQFDGKNIEFYSEWIDKKPETILFKMEEQKSIALYIDKENTNNYYMDIDWLR